MSGCWRAPKAVLAGRVAVYPEARIPPAPGRLRRVQSIGRTGAGRPRREPLGLLKRVGPAAGRSARPAGSGDLDRQSGREAGPVRAGDDSASFIADLKARVSRARSSVVTAKRPTMIHAPSRPRMPAGSSARISRASRAASSRKPGAGDSIASARQGVSRSSAALNVIAINSSPFVQRYSPNYAVPCRLSARIAIAAARWMLTCF